MAPNMLDTAEAAALPFDARLGRALEGIPFLDDATRPKAPPIPGVTSAQRAQGRRLALYHRHHLAELAAVRAALDRFVAGTGPVEAMTDGVSSLSLAKNYRAFGNLCGRQCQLLQMHHDIEEGDLYPRLRQAAGLQQVLDRLSAEHRTVHGLLERIRDIVQSVAVGPTVERVLALREVYEVFERVVVSHFGYEERELEEAIGYYDAL
ncbi:hypothetical protein MOTC310_26055 [Methylobacterium oryzae]|uniref:Hemerythrin-like domain-containing protein n=2 Tax=Methylobacterium oryzae TaxID=334852 RepID=A0ABU7TVB4_9HYPH